MNTTKKIGGAMDKIFINKLRIDCIVGITPPERIHLQPLFADIIMEKDLKSSGYRKDLSLSIDYAEVCRRVTSYVLSSKAELLEELGVGICDLILKEFKPVKVTVRLSKTEILPQTGAVGIEISKSLEE